MKGPEKSDIEEVVSKIPKSDNVSLEDKEAKGRPSTLDIKHSKAIVEQS